MRVGVYGFKGDPLHILHLILAERARVQHKLDVVYFVTAGHPVDKPADEVTDKEIRHAIVEAMIADNPHFKASRVEIDRDGPSYMADTLRHFHELHGEDSQYFLIIGEDRAPTLKTWKETDAILKLATILVGPRKSDKVDKDWLKQVLPAGAVFDTVDIDYSSTFIRGELAAGRSVRYLVTEAGLAEIAKHPGLYGSSKAAVAAEVQPTPSGQDLVVIARRKSMKPTPMIPSILDNDLYKLSMANAGLRKYPNVRVVYRFTDRKPKGKWTAEALAVLKAQIRLMAKLKLTAEERAYCEEQMPWINRGFWDYLANYRYNPKEVKVWIDKQGNLQIEIKGLWCSTIFWEVPLLALVSQVYFQEIDTDWSEEGQDEKMAAKAAAMAAAGVMWGDFGTRRRRSLASQERVVLAGKQYSNFTGTSNVYLAMKHGVKPLGTMAHEWIMAHSVLFSMRHANKFALEAWNDVYRGDLGTALPDTYGTDAFLRDFDGVLARLFDSVRHDSGDPYKWAQKMIAHYKKLGIPVKTLGFTDSNTAESAIALHKWMAEQGLKCWFGIGTSLSNDYDGSPALSIVIKLYAVEDWDGTLVPVVKLSDTPEKASGDQDAVRVAFWTHYGRPLDAPKSA